MRSGFAGIDAKAWLWFVSSYAPLWIMLGLRFESCWFRLGLIALGLGSGLYVAYMLTRRKAERPSNVTLTIVGDAGIDASGYLAAYLLPFLTVAVPKATDVAAYVIFLFVAGVVYVRSGLMQINPTVYVVGRRVFRATIPVRGASKEVFVITRRDLGVGGILKAERFSDRVYVDHGAGPHS